MKRQSLSAAMRCETAKNSRCKCRCGGRLHGAMRAAEILPGFFENLPADDPHHALPKRVPKPRVLKKDRIPPLLEGIVS